MNAVARISRETGAARRAGRRPGESRTRDAILQAARATFAELGYERATLRVIGERAAVDPALALHYFGSKDGLFTAALELPIRPHKIFEHMQEGDAAKLGETIVRRFLEAWEPPEMRVRLMAMLRSAMTNDVAMDKMRELLTRQVLGPVTERLGVPDAQLRATLVGSQLLGLAMMRYVGRLEPLASASVDGLVTVVGPTVQRFLTGGLSAADGLAATSGAARQRRRGHRESGRGHRESGRGRS